MQWADFCLTCCSKFLARATEYLPRQQTARPALKIPFVGQ